MDFDFMNAMTQQEEAVQEPVQEHDDALSVPTGQLSQGESQDEPEVDNKVEQQDVPSADGTDAAKPEQTAEQRAGFAAARRRAEAEWLPQKQAAEAFYQRMDAMAKARGFKNIEELEQAVHAEAEARRAEDYKQKYGIDPNAVKPLLDEVVDKHPAIQAARQAEAQAKIAAGRKALSDAIAEIGKLDDRIKTFEDLPKMDNYEQFDDLVRNRGYRMLDAYKLCNMDRLQEMRAKAARQETRNSINSRSHLKQTGGGAAGDAAVVPADVKAMYKQFNPNASDAEILAHWQKSQKE